MKRTKRYGGFLVGDRVRVKKKADAVYWDFECMMEGTVVSKIKGYLNIEFIDKNGGKHYFGRYPYQLINLTRQEECERNKEQLDKFTRKHFNQSADEYLKEDMEMTKKIIEDFCKPMTSLPRFDWISQDDLLKGLEDHDIMPPKANFNPAKEMREKAELEMIKDFVDEALRQTEIFLSPLSPLGDTLPSPYTRDVYTTTKDY